MSQPSFVERALIMHIWVLICRSMAVYCLSVDGVALITFKNTLTSDPQSALGDWNASQDTPCAWSGVTCSNSTDDTGIQHVVGLELVGKQLSGLITPALGALTFLQTLKLQGNMINSSLPEELFNATSLQTLLLAGNRITGSLPSQVGNLINLKVLDLSSNIMLGTIPQSITYCTKLQTLMLARNLFSGPLPDGLGTNLTSLEQLDLSSNLLSGSIPSDFGKLSALRGTLNLSYNHLCGQIPLSLGNLPYIVSLDLSHNNLSGRIPQDGSLSEQGPNPFLHNPGLCGFPLPIACPVTPFLSPLPSLPTESSVLPITQSGQFNSTHVPNKPNLSPAAIIAIVLGDAAGVFMLACLFVYMYWRARSCKEGDVPHLCLDKEVKRQWSRRGCFGRSSSDESEVSASSEKAKEQGELVALDKEFSFDIDELLRASAYVLGKSGLGIVSYKVVLGNGTPVAVQRIGEGSSQKRKEFEAEVQAISKLRHANVVQLLAYYWSDNEKLLIYEFISHGSLATALHAHSQRPSRVLTWEERLQIARGIARGLAYLHECSPRKYVHGNIKTTKILLDGVMHPYIADFGLLKLANIANDDGNTQQSGIWGQSMFVPGAAPVFDWSGPQAVHSSSIYRAPEALPQMKATQKWDVYAYGVVVMELLSGRSPTSGVDMVAWIRKSGLAVPARIVDPSMGPVAHLPAVASLLSIALACTSASPEQRPKMRSVADSLDKLVSLTRDSQGANGLLS